MNDQEAKELVDEVFGAIKKAKTIADLIAIPSNVTEVEKNLMDEALYPKIEFELSKDEIQSLVDANILAKDFQITAGISAKINDPLTKLLYAMAWKNGDLKKLQHIANGITNADGGLENQTKALVFYQFGRHLSKASDQPIIDQHVIRAFGIFQADETANIKKFRKLNILNKNHREIIQEYITWLSSDALTNELKAQKDYSYPIDKVLFATGKTVKDVRSKNEI